MSYRPIILILSVLWLAFSGMSTYACTCVHNPKWTPRDEVNFVDLVVEGKIISVTDYSDSNFPWNNKLFRLVIEKKYKSPLSMPDTVSIITGQDGGSWGYAFKVGKEYIVYARIKTQKNTMVSVQPDTSKDKPMKAASHTMFETDICTATKEATRRELTALRKLTS